MQSKRMDLFIYLNESNRMKDARIQLQFVHLFVSSSSSLDSPIYLHKNINF